MESPKYEFIEREIMNTKNLMSRMEKNMRSQLERQSDVDNIKTKRKIEGFQNDEELETEMESFRKRLKNIDFSEEKSQLFPQKEEIFVKNREYLVKTTEKIRKSEDFSHKNEENEDFLGPDAKKPKEIPSFNERKYQLEIKMLREELDKLRKTKTFLEKELGTLKVLTKKPTTIRKSNKNR